MIVNNPTDVLYEFFKPMPLGMRCRMKFGFISKAIRLNKSDGQFTELCLCDLGHCWSAVNWQEHLKSSHSHILYFCYVLFLCVNELFLCVVSCLQTSLPQMTR